MGLKMDTSCLSHSLPFLPVNTADVEHKQQHLNDLAYWEVVTGAKWLGSIYIVNDNNSHI